ncbi:PD-(D/E)XK nuclease family protein [Campylobacter cuniculorum]|uniref:Exonuclease V, helicase AddB n=2 Tax=Campylobacter cuniculorum TaxID=374106 RepID=A0A1W6BV94_9BACT|nr:PD-(D/E)XK nuclease family protein [Campylobacter cuniculorum]ARJ55981.1 exonuclease V, helicase AddB [Campylobacter cuniculorum DSM 23162 = LMG 24588]QOR05202.1 PD-(D/E)XK nuclease family protein [Campylobacter cuniculorum]
MKLLVFSSSRKIKEYYNSFKNQDSLIDNAILIEDFLENVCLVKGRKASEYESLLFMQEACKQSKDLEQKLGISSEFFAFLRNNEYLFSFFKELCLEKKDIQELKNNDYYAAYNEHLEILDEVLKNYLNLLKTQNLYDNLSLIRDYFIHWDFLEDYESIIYDMQGFLSTFEKDLLKELSKRKSVILKFNTSVFNLEYLKSLDFLEHLNLEINKSYEFNISTKEMLKQDAFDSKNTSIKVQSFELRSLQVAYVMNEIATFIHEGLKAENIVVITPDESFCELLKLLDKNNNLNFASGKSIQESEFYQKLRALYLSANLEDFDFNETKDYFEDKKTIFDYHNSLLHYFELEFKEFKRHFNQKCDLEYFNALLERLLENENDELKFLIKEQMLFIADLFKNQTLKLKELLELFLIQIKSLKLSSVGGGKVVVMGLLESRGLCFDGVIIVDFNDDIIPKRSVNELFLNNEIRKNSGLISYERRENLQRFYYESLMKNAQKISISYVENEEKIKSRFLDELAFKCDTQTEFTQKAYLQALKFDYKPIKLDLKPLDAPVLKHKLFDKPLSFSRLNLFLKQKRTYYYRYILNLLEPRAFLEQNRAKNLGILIHKLLELYYKNNEKNHFDEKKFLILLENEKHTINALDFEILKLKSHHFAQSEKKHFEQGFKVSELEYKISEDNPKIFQFQTPLGQVKSVDLIGQIDRIDTLLGKDKLIIDYKNGKIEENSYQLAFYKALSFENADAKFYDLNDFVLKTGKNTKTLEELKELFSELLEQDEFEFENEKDTYCPYKLIYKKDLK